MGLFSLASLANPHGILLAAGLGALVGAASIGSGTYYVTHAVMKSKLDDIETRDAVAQKNAVIAAAATQHAQDLIAQDAAVAEAVAQKALEDQRNEAPRYIVQHVRDTVVCVPYGVVRTINFYANGSDPNRLAPGQPDDACTQIPWRSLTADLADDYSTGNENAEQLNNLEATVTKIAGTVPPAPADKPDLWQRIFGGK